MEFPLDSREGESVLAVRVHWLRPREMEVIPLLVVDLRQKQEQLFRGNAYAYDSSSEECVAYLVYGEESCLYL